MSIPDFIARCDRYCDATDRKRGGLSKVLFDDTNRLDDLASGESDVGVMRLERASKKLAEMEAALAALPANDTQATEKAA